MGLRRSDDTSEREPVQQSSIVRGPSGARDVPRSCPTFVERESKNLRATVVADAGYASRVLTSETQATARGPEHLLLVDKLMERCAFERTTACLYEAIDLRVAEHGSFPGGPTRAMLSGFAKTKLRHVDVVAAALYAFGAGPPPDAPAFVSHAALRAVLALVEDPGTALPAALDAIAIVELADERAWGVLVELCRRAGNPGLGGLLDGAQKDACDHLHAVRTWIAAASAVSAAPGGP